MTDLYIRYLGLVEKAKVTLQIAVIASLNGVTPYNQLGGSSSNTEQTPAP
jgi:hypothetical protein